MTADDTDDFDIVATNPAAYYTGPADVFDDPDLTREQKLRLLEEWEIDLTRQLESDGEGMAQGGGGGWVATLSRGGSQRSSVV